MPRSSAPYQWRSQAKLVGKIEFCELAGRAPINSRHWRVRLQPPHNETVSGWDGEKHAQRYHIMLWLNGNQGANPCSTVPGGIIIERVKARRSVLLQTGALEATGVCLCWCASARACVCVYGTRLPLFPLQRVNQSCATIPPSDS